MLFQFDCFEITGIACAVPDEVQLSTDWAELFGRKAVNRFVQSTGVTQRYIGDHLGITASDLCCKAAQLLRDKEIFSPEEIDAVVFMSIRRDYESPATAFVIQHRLNLPEDCICLDVPLGCSAFIHGLFLASSLIASGCDTILLLNGESMHGASQHPESIPMLFGSAGSASLIRRRKNSHVSGLLKSFGRGFDLQVLPYSGYRHPLNNLADNTSPQKIFELSREFRMDGYATMWFALNEVVDCIKEALKHFGKTVDFYDYFALHQANKLIIDSIAKTMEMPSDKVLISIDQYANTAGASIPLTLCHCLGQMQESEKKKILACGYGVGLSVGVAELEISPQICFPIIRTKERFDDGIRMEETS